MQSLDQFYKNSFIKWDAAAINIHHQTTIKKKNHNTKDESNIQVYEMKISTQNEMKST